MKNKVVIVGLVSLFFASATYAQGVETDDMYFNSKDRAKLKALRANEEATYTASVKRSKKQEASEDENLNPTDSYSARNVNPEFAARSTSETAQYDNQDYFVNNYQYNTASNLNRWNNSFNSWYNSPWYASPYYGSSMNNWNSPYYNSYYDAWGNPYYYRSGWGSSLYSGFGSPYGYGWNSGFGFNYGYSPYMSSWGYGSSFGLGFGYGGYGYGGYYPGTVVIVNNGGDSGRNIAYGKRGSARGAMAGYPNSVTSGGRTRTDYVPSTGNSGTITGRSTSGGRVATAPSTPAPTRGQRQEDYYNRSWRNLQQSQGQSSAPARGSSTWNNSGNGNGGWNNTRSSSWGNSNSSFGGRSSGSFESGGGGGSRSSAPASSGSNGRSRGRD